MPIVKKGTKGNDTLEGTGDLDYLYGYGGMDVLIGLGGNDHLDGGASGDTMIGGLGDDHYYVDNALDNVIENAGEGTDWVHSKKSNYTLHANVENLTLEYYGNNWVNVSNGTGNNLDNIIYGNAWSNVINGGGGDDTLYGEYGPGGIGFLADTLIGGTGDDKYYVNMAADVVTEAADEGTDTIYYTGSTSYALGANVENLNLGDAVGAINGTGNGLDNNIDGNNDVNTLTGGGGDDDLDGWGGADTLIGGTGDDNYRVDTAGDIVVEAAGEGTDSIYFRGNTSYVLSATVENLYMTYAVGAINGTGNGLDNIISGNDDVNTLTGGGGDDRLNGRGGADTMIGGTGDDDYYVDSAGDVVVEAADEGTDTIYFTGSTNYALGANVENLHMTNAVGAVNGTGNGLDNDIWGNSSNNVLTGAAGNDWINGGGGADTMIGGIGDDEYIVDNVGDVIVENANQGDDWVTSSVDYTLGEHSERLYLTGGAISATGNGSNNVIGGTNGANILDGGGGADTMYGGEGDDHYWVDHAGDQTLDLNIPGTADWVWSSIDWTLNAYVENLTLLDGAGELDGFGNAYDNEIYGNGSANLLDGKSGADTVLGGGGNDTLRYWHGDGVDHLDGGADNDTVDFSMFSKAVWVGLDDATTAWTTGTWDATGSGPWTEIASIDNVENLVGTFFHDRLIGDAGDNRIDGEFGNDVLTGGAGQDAFVFSTVLITGNVDQVTDFNVADDSFHLDNAESVFSGLADGALAAAQFHVGATAADADDRIVYNSATGALFYDYDGSGGGVSIQFAQVSAGLAITHEDFLVV